MKKHFYFLFLLPFFLFSCYQKEKNLLDLGASTPLSAVEYTEELIIASPWYMTLFDNNLLIFQDKVSVIAFIDPESGRQIGSWGKKGRGPNEFILATYWGKSSDNRTIHIYDPNNSMKLRKYYFNNQKDSLELKDEIAFNPQAYIPFGLVLDNELIVGNAFDIFDTPGSSLLLLNKNGEIVSDIGRLPDKEHLTKDLLDYSGRLSSFGNEFVFVMEWLGYIAFYSVSQDGQISLKWEHFLENPLYKKDNSLDVIHLKQGFLDVYMTKDYIFCSYCGKQYEAPFESETLLVFDYEGKLLRNYALDKKIARIAASPDGKIIYASVDVPEAGIVRFYTDL